MSGENNYCIQAWWKQDNSWRMLGPKFHNMEEEFAMGAWAMLKSHYGKKRRFRLALGTEEPDAFETLEEFTSPDIRIEDHTIYACHP